MKWEKFLVKFIVVVMLVAFASGISWAFDYAKLKNVPDGAIWRQQYVRSKPVPINRFKTLVAWAQVATKHREKERNNCPCEVVIDYLRIVAQDKSGQEKVVYEDEYRQPRSAYDSGLFFRGNKWFSSDEREVAWNTGFASGMYHIGIGLTPDNIVHWWTDRITKEDGIKYFIEARFKVTGDSAIQFGMDLWTSDNSPYNGYDPKCEKSNNCEIMVSDWYGDTKGKFITIRAPIGKE